MPPERPAPPRSRRQCRRRDGATGRLSATSASRLIKDLIHKAFSGSGKELVLAALGGHVTQQEREEIDSILDQEK
jgi:hypothetical protein